MKGICATNEGANANSLRERKPAAKARGGTTAHAKQNADANSLRLATAPQQRSGHPAFKPTKLVALSASKHLVKPYFSNLPSKQAS